MRGTLAWTWGKGAFWALLALPVCSAPSWAEPPMVSQRLTYELNVGGFTAAEATVVVTLPTEPLPAGAPYRLQTTLETQGLAAMVVSFQSRSESKGQIYPPSQQPPLRALEHHTRNQWRDNPRRVDMVYPPLGSPPLEAAPSAITEPPDLDRDPVATSQTAGSLDPLSATLSLLLQAAAQDGPHQEDVSQVVFDGRRLYRLTLSPLTAAPVSSPAYQGPGWRAEITYERLGGRSSESFFKLSAKPLHARLDLAPAKALGLPYPVPLRVEADTLNFGGMVVILTAAAPHPAPSAQP